MNKNLVIPLVILLLISCKENKNDKTVQRDPFLVKIDTTLKIAVKQYEFLSEHIAPSRYPKTYHEDTDSLETSGSDWWCSGFYPGTMIYLNEINPSEKLQTKIYEYLNDLKKEQYNTSTHDLGFMMYCSFGNAERLKKTKAYEDVLMNSAKSLATRYNDTVKAIRSWDSAPWNKAGEDDLVVIIDNMMNLELLFWATKFSKDSIFYNIAVNHANTTIKNHFRPDYSSYHEVIYDEKTGNIKAQITNQGSSDTSSWARGQAWGLYGYTVAFRETGAKNYLEQSKHIADYLLNHSNLPKDKIPYWDFNAPNIPDALRDSSAAAIMASALIELSTFTEGAIAMKYLDNAKTILVNLMSSKYLAKVGENGGFLLKHGVGNMPNKTEIDTPLSYGDYYFVEAILRHINITNKKD